MNALFLNSSERVLCRESTTAAGKGKDCSPSTTRTTAFRNNKVAKLYFSMASKQFKVD